MKKIPIFVFFLVLLSFFGYKWFNYKTEKEVLIPGVNLQFEIKKGETALDLIEKLYKNKVIDNKFIFKLYLKIKQLDTNIYSGVFIVEKPVTIKKIVEQLTRPESKEIEITLLPGWDLGDIANYFEQIGLAQKEEIFELLGYPAVDYRQKIDLPKLKLKLPGNLKILQTKPTYVSYEGYLAPDTYKVFKDQDIQEILIKILKHRQQEIDSLDLGDFVNKEEFYKTLIVASLVEREVKDYHDKQLVADIFYRRLENGWLLQADSSIHYLTQKKGNVFTNKQDRQIDSLWNTYKYKGLPLSPICNPSLETIKAVLNRQANDYWYFLTDYKGRVHYAQTLKQHNLNRYKYLN